MDKNKSPRVRLVHRAKQVEVSVQARQYEEQDIAYQVRDFVLCGLPYKKNTDTKYERRNGSSVLQLVGDTRYGLPYGQDRLLIIWLVTAFQFLGCPENNNIRFRSISDLVRAFFRDGQNRKISGLELRRMKERIMRLFYTSFFLQNEIQNKKRLVLSRMGIISGVKLWFHTNEEHPNGLWQNVIKLDTQFADLIRESSIPFDMQTIRGLKESPATLDLYLWLAWRTFRIKAGNQIDVPLFGPEGLFAQFGGEASEHWKARQQLKGWLAEIKLFWPLCPASLSNDGLYLVLDAPTHRTFAVQRNAPIRLPGVSRHPPIILPATSAPFILDRDDNDPESR